MGQETVSLIEAAQRLDVYVMTSASIYQGQLARNLPPIIGEFLPGLESDAQGRVYLSDYEHNVIRRRTLANEIETLMHDPRALWPDTLSLAADGYHICPVDFDVTWL